MINTRKEENTIEKIVSRIDPASLFFLGYNACALVQQVPSKAFSPSFSQSLEKVSLGLSDSADFWDICYAVDQAKKLAEHFISLIQFEKPMNQERMWTVALAVAGAVCSFGQMTAGLKGVGVVKKGIEIQIIVTASKWAGFFKHSYRLLNPDEDTSRGVSALLLVSNIMGLIGVIFRDSKHSALQWINNNRGKCMLVCVTGCNVLEYVLPLFKPEVEEPKKEEPLSSLVDFGIEQLSEPLMADLMGSCSLLCQVLLKDNSFLDFEAAKIWSKEIRRYMHGYQVAMALQGLLKKEYDKEEIAKGICGVLSLLPFLSDYAGLGLNQKKIYLLKYGVNIFFACFFPYLAHQDPLKKRCENKIAERYRKNKSKAIIGFQLSIAMIATLKLSRELKVLHFQQLTEFVAFIQIFGGVSKILADRYEEQMEVLAKQKLQRRKLSSHGQ